MVAKFRKDFLGRAVLGILVLAIFACVTLANAQDAKQGPAVAGTAAAVAGTPSAGGSYPLHAAAKSER